MLNQRLGGTSLSYINWTQAGYQGVVGGLSSGIAYESGISACLGVLKSGGSYAGCAIIWKCL